MNAASCACSPSSAMSTRCCALATASTIFVFRTRSSAGCASARRRSFSAITRKGFSGPRARGRGGSRRVLMVHSTPWEPRGAYLYPHSPLLERFAEIDADIVLYGHTHHQLVRRVGRVLVVNPGSAGEARDPRNGRQLSCAVLDTVSQEVRVINFPDGPEPAGLT